MTAGASGHLLNQRSDIDSLQPENPSSPDRVTGQLTPSGQTLQRTRARRRDLCCDRVADERPVLINQLLSFSRGLPAVCK